MGRASSGVKIPEVKSGKEMPLPRQAFHIYQSPKLIISPRWTFPAPELVQGWRLSVVEAGISLFAIAMYSLPELYYNSLCAALEPFLGESSEPLVLQQRLVG
jgi:hypothetical protein